MVTIDHKLRLFFDGIVFFLWGRNTFDLVKDLLDGEIKIQPINDFISFMFSFVGLAYLSFKLVAAIRMHLLDYKMKQQEIREKTINNNKLEDEDSKN